MIPVPVIHGPITNTHKGGAGMDYPFRMYGETVEIYRYKVDYTEQIDPEGGPEAVTEYSPYQDEAQVIADRHSGTVTALDTSGYEWMDGLELGTYDDAMAAYDLGETAYNEKIQQEQAMSLEAQITDLQLALAELYETTML